MFTLFDLLKLFGALAGAAAGGLAGGATFGWLGTIAGIPVGCLIGILVGNLPWVIAWALMRWELKRSSAEKLKARLQREYCIAHLLIAELASRGEPVEQFHNNVTGLLRSQNADERRFGTGVARTWFPDLVPAIPASPESGCEK